MRAWGPLVVIVALGAVAWVGGTQAPLRPVFAIAVPALGMAVFLAGLAIRVWRWAATPVPFRTPTSCGQQRSLPWIKASWLENPWTRMGVIGRVALEVLLFRSLFRNTQASMTRTDDETNVRRLVYGEQKWLWLAAIAFHWSLLVVLLRHLRFVLQPVPAFVSVLAAIDGFFELGTPALYATDVTILAGLAYLLVRRLTNAQVRYLSLSQDYFALYLLLGLVGTGVVMRYLAREDVVAIKQLALGWVTLAPEVPTGVGPLFFVHLSLASGLFAYLPFSKLVHMAGVFLSPTRTLANTSRARRHVNPWNPVVDVHSYEEWEDEFRDKIKAAGLPLEKV